MILLLLGLAQAAEPLSLMEAIDIGATRSFGAQRVNPTRGAAIAEARAEAAWAEDPRLAFERDDHGDTLALTVPIETEAWMRRRTAERWRAVAGQDAMLARVEAGLSAGAAWLDAWQAAEVARLYTDAQALAAEVQRAARARVAAGEWPASESALLQADAARALGRSLDAQRTAHLALLDLQRALGKNPDGNVVLGAWAPLPAAPPSSPVESPIVLRADLARRAARLEANTAAWVRAPDLALTTGATLGDAPATALYGVEMTLPLGRSPKGAEARAELGEVNLREAQAQAQIDRSAADSELQITGLLVEAWQIEGLGELERTLGQLLVAGELSLPDYVARRELATEARLGSIEAQWRRARAELDQWAMAGALPGMDD